MEITESELHKYSEGTVFITQDKRLWISTNFNEKSHIKPKISNTFHMPSNTIDEGLFISKDKTWGYYYDVLFSSYVVRYKINSASFDLLICEVMDVL